MDGSSHPEVATRINQTTTVDINSFATPGSSDASILDAWSSLLLYHCDTYGTPAVSRFLLLASFIHLTHFKEIQMIFQPLTYKRFLTFILTICLSATCLAKWPTKDVTFVVPYPPGGVNDILARSTAEDLSKKYNVAFHVKNMPGAFNVPAVNYILNSANDNHTFLFSDSDLIAGSISQNLGHHTQFVPIGIAGYAPFVLYGGPSATLTRLKAQSQVGSIVNVGANTSAMPWIKSIKDTPLQFNIVPYRGTPPLINDVLAQHTEYGVLAIVSFYTFIDAGKLTPLAVATEKRNPAIPDVPTIQELGWKGDYAFQYWGAFARKDTDPEALAAVTNAFHDTVAKNPKIQAFTKQGFVITNLNPANSVKFMAQEVTKNERIKSRQGQ